MSRRDLPSKLNLRTRCVANAVNNGNDGRMGGFTRESRGIHFEFYKVVFTIKFGESPFVINRDSIGFDAANVVCDAPRQIATIAVGGNILYRRGSSVNRDGIASGARNAGDYVLADDFAVNARN